ncbi:MAG: hypothetical protein JST54_16600 [Deltaproteobacteria bacterium]|nr:hypothetical protein [Deltaproteobacteria bacterium]
MNTKTLRLSVLLLGALAFAETGCHHHHPGGDGDNDGDDHRDGGGRNAAGASGSSGGGSGSVGTAGSSGTGSTGASNGGTTGSSAGSTGTSAASGSTGTAAGSTGGTSTGTTGLDGGVLPDGGVGCIPGTGVDVIVQDDQGHPITNGFRWLVELDNSYGATPGQKNPDAPLGAVPGNPSYSLGVNIHHSHAPTLCAGDTAPANNADTFPPTDVPLAGTGASSFTLDACSCPGFDPAQRHFVSVLPWHTSPGGTPGPAQTGYTMSGRGIAPGQTQVTVIVHPFPVPTAQITALVFEDNQPLNAAYDQPSEHGLPGFALLLTDPIGAILQDAFGNPLGTTYQYACTMPDGRPAAGTQDGQGNVTCSSPLTALTQEQQPIFQRDPSSGLPVVAFLGDGNLWTCPGTTKLVASYTPYEQANCIDPYTLTPLQAGEAVVRYLTSNKYSIEPIPPGNDPNWLLTGTLEGTRRNDAWVRATEPRYNINLGQLNWLVFYGFARPQNNLASVPNPTHAALGNITGQVTWVHDMHPPLQAGLNPGLPVPNAYVAVNNFNGNDELIYAAPADPATGAFEIDGLVPGTYQLAFFDKQINAIIDYRIVNVTPGQTQALGPISIFRWFGTYQGSVFSDLNQNGFHDSGEPGVSGVPVNLHYTDGSLYGSTQTDGDGNFLFPQVFPWWRFIVADVDLGRNKATGMTAYVDNGGPLPPTPLGDQGINPQLQPDGNEFRTQLGLDSVTQAMTTYQDMTNRIDFGKAPWAPGENGGIHGIVNYALTRTEEDPSTSALDPWEPNVPRVTVTLHHARQDFVTGTPEANYWVLDDTAGFPLTTTTDSWDDNQPTGCVGSQGTATQGPLLWPNPEIVNGFAIPSCAETFYNWDQIRPGVMDGTFWFQTMPDGSPIPPGDYIVQVTPPPGYQVIAWGDRDIDVGDPKYPFLTQTPPCVGATYPVPPYLRWFPDQQNQTLFPGGWVNDTWTNPTAAACDLKYIALNPGANPEVDFNLFTWVPKAARMWGTVWNDLQLEFNPASPNASGNFGVPNIPVAIKDYAGVEIGRYYTDQWGHFDGLVPANYDIVPPIPLGLTLAMYSVLPNDPGPILDTRPNSPTRGQYITDPQFNPAYTPEAAIVENWEFYSGKTTFIDTIVLPSGAFAENPIPLNCDFLDGTPEIQQVSDVVIPQVSGGFNITIMSSGTITGPNPNFDPNDPNSPTTVTLDHGFSSSGTVSVGGTALPAGNVTWAADGRTILARIPNGLSGQLEVTRGDNGKKSTVGVTLHISSPNVPVIDVHPPAANCVGLACGVIQPAIDAAPPGAIVVLEPGTYQENVNLWKPLTLQGKGAVVTTFDAAATQSNFPLKQAQFAEIQTLITNGAIGLVPNQASDFTLEEGAGILVAGCGTSPSCGPTTGGVSSFFAPGAQARIDGIGFRGANERAGAILLNGFVNNLQITNDDIYQNQGSIGGGIRVGENALIGPGNPTGSSFNPNLVIDHNHIANNGSIFFGGGGIALFAGSDNYQVTSNLICGNFSANYGGGIGHFGLSQNGLIANNLIYSNESTDEGGGIHIAGEDPVGGAALSLGAGSVRIENNLIQGNKAGDDGAGVRALHFNGQDVSNNPTDPTQWYQIDILNNIIVNNSSADTGGGISLDDAIKANIIGDTVAHNDSTATGSDAFGTCTENSPVGQVCPLPEGQNGGGLVNSVPQVAGIATAGHSTTLYLAMTATGSYCATAPADPICAPFGNPMMVDDIVWQNRSFYWDATANQGLGALLPTPGRTYWDLGVYPNSNTPTTPTPQTLSPSYSVLTDGVGATANPTNPIGSDPNFLSSYFNTYSATSAGAALGNYVVATFTPHGILSDYGIGPGSSALGAGSHIPPGTATDYAGNTRADPVDIGALQGSSIFPGPYAIPVTRPTLGSR